MTPNANHRHPHPADPHPADPHPAATQPADPAPMAEALAVALGRAPAVAIPEDFAARVARRAVEGGLPRAIAPNRRSAIAPQLLRTAPRLGWGTRLAMASGGLLMLGMFALAPQATPSLSNLRFDAELVMFIELSGLLLFSRRLLAHS